MNPEKSTHEDEDREKLLKPRTHKRVLIMCQRKVSNLPHDKSVAKAVLDIDTYIKTHFGEDATIEYLTHYASETHTNYADHMFPLSRSETLFGVGEIHENNMEKLNTFLETNNKKYDVIILNTCPLLWLDFNMIHELLKSGGILVVKEFRETNTTGERAVDKIININVRGDVPANLFTKQHNSPYGFYSYIKIETAQGKKSKKTYKRVARRQKKIRSIKRRSIKRRRAKK